MKTGVTSSPPAGKAARPYATSCSVRSAVPSESASECGSAERMPSLRIVSMTGSTPICATSWAETVLTLLAMAVRSVSGPR